MTRYEVITTPTDIIMVIEYAGGELFNYIVEVRPPSSPTRFLSSHLAGSTLHEMPS